MYRSDLAGILKSHGRKCVVEPYNYEKRITVKAIINPVIHRTKLYLTENYRADGFSDSTHYLYIGEPRINLADFPLGTKVRCSGDTYTIKYSALYTDGKNALYCWAVLEKYGGGDDR